MALFGIKVRNRIEFKVLSFNLHLGEANVDNNRDKYNCTFPKMIESWRQTWNNRTNGITDLTFVQVSFFFLLKYKLLNNRIYIVINIDK